MTKQVVTHMETHINGLHSYSRFYWNNGHVARIETDRTHDSGTYGTTETPEYELGQWLREVSLKDWLEDKSEYDARVL